MAPIWLGLVDNLMLGLIPLLLLMLSADDDGVGKMDRYSGEEEGSRKWW